MGAAYFPKLQEADTGEQLCLVFLLADKNSDQVTIPDKGSHYLKKSPSPTGSKLPPGEGGALSPINGNNDHLEEGSPVKKTQQVGASTVGESFKKVRRNGRGEREFPFPVIPKNGGL